MTIGSGHLLDGITYMLGQFSEVSAILGTQFQNVKVIETGEIVQATSPDYVLRKWNHGKWRNRIKSCT